MASCYAGARRAYRRLRSDVAPLCPAGHLPHKGGDRLSALPALLSATSKIGEARDAGQSPPLWGRCPAGQRGAREERPGHEPRPRYSAHFTLVRSLAWIGAFSHRPSTLASQTPIFGSSNRKPLTASSARIFCACLKSSVRLASSEVRFSSSDDLVEGRVVVVEVVVLARIDIDVVRLGVRDDGEVVVLVGEDLLQPVGPFDRDDLEIDADLAQLRSDDLAAKPRIGRRRQLQRRLEAVWRPASLSSSLALAMS